MRKITYAQAINEALHEEMARDSKVYILGEDVCHDLWETHDGLSNRFGMDRVRETAISEKAIVGSAVGAAMAGYRPIADLMFADFFFCAADEILNQAATIRFSNGGHLKVPVVIKAPIGGGGGAGPMHSQCPEGLVWHRPGLKVVLPATPYDAKGLLKTAIRDNNAVIYFYHKELLGISGEVPEEEYTIPFGQAKITRQGTDVTVIATSMMVPMAVQVADVLSEQGIEMEVIDLRTLEPLDMNTILASAKKTRRVVVVDEDNLRCGVTGEIGMQIMEQAFDSLTAPVARVAAMDVPIPAGVLEETVLPGHQDIAAAVGKVLGMPPPLTVSVKAEKSGWLVG